MPEHEVKVVYETFTTKMLYSPDIPDDVQGIIQKVAESRIKQDVPEADIIGIYHSPAERLGVVHDSEGNETPLRMAVIESRVCLVEETHEKLKAVLARKQAAKPTIK